MSLEASKQATWNMSLLNEKDSSVWKDVGTFVCSLRGTFSVLSLSGMLFLLLDLGGSGSNSEKRRKRASERANMCDLTDG